MKKLVASIAAGIMIAGAAVTSVSADEHEVQKGESLWDIANEYDTTLDELIEINKLKSTVIHPKQVILIDESDGNLYTVEKGDTLGKISKQFGITVNELKDWNHLSSDLIVVGQELSVNGVQVAQAEPTTTSAENVSNESETNNNDTANEAKAETNASTEEKVENNTSEEVVKEQTNNQDKAEGKTISVTATAYTGDCSGCSGITATGVDLNKNPNAKVIAVDPNVIPLGSEVYVEGYGYATAADTGGAISGNKIDVHVPTKDEALNWGNKTVNVTIVK